MDAQLSVRLPRDLAEALARAARQGNLKRADVVRAALREFLGSTGPDEAARPIDLVRDLIGKAECLAPDSGSRTRRAIVGRLRDRATRSA